MVYTKFLLKKIEKKNNQSISARLEFEGIQNTFFFFLVTLNSSTPMSDQDRISPYNIDTISPDK